MTDNIKIPIGVVLTALDKDGTKAMCWSFSKDNPASRFDSRSALASILNSGKSAPIAFYNGDLNFSTDGVWAVVEDGNLFVQTVDGVSVMSQSEFNIEFKGWSRSYHNSGVVDSGAIKYFGELNNFYAALWLESSINRRGLGKIGAWRV